MKIGCHLPMYGPIGTRDNVIAFARRIEALGYDSLWASDHVVLPHRMTTPYPYSPTGKFPLAPDVPFLEPLTTLALVAGVTERVQLGTSILVLPHRNPVLAAKMCATLDHLAGGRLVLDVGVGWMREEIELLGGSYDERGAWSDEALAVMRACWRDARPSHHGRFFSLDDVGAFPKPPRGDIPILVGGHTPRALRRVVDLCRELADAIDDDYFRDKVRAVAEFGAELLSRGEPRARGALSGGDYLRQQIRAALELLESRLYSLEQRRRAGQLGNALFAAHHLKR